MNIGIKETEKILEKIKDAKILLYGDFCLDAYWVLDPRGSEVSVETGLKALAAGNQRYSLGGASNVAANIAALNPKIIKITGVAGNDIFGREMISKLENLNIDTSSMVIQKEDFETYVFCKLILEGNEQPRIDFGTYNKRSKQTDQMILDHIRRESNEADIIILNQQVPGSITNKEFIDGLNQIIKERQDKIFIVDSRHYSSEFMYVSLKTNEVEAAVLNGINASFDDIFNIKDVKMFAQEIFNKHKRPCFISRGKHGILACDEKGIHEIGGLQFLKKLDTVGAGDTVLSALGCALAVKIGVQDAIEFANYAAGVTVQKLYQTGTASAEEILNICADPNFIYQPELAEDIRSAVYWKDSEVELCCKDLHSFEKGKIKHAVFDHDGTISVLREGWELVMEPMMIKAILGDMYKNADDYIYNRVVNRVRDYIDKSTGIQTIQQMEGLIELIEEFNFIPKDKILDKFGYKEIYNDALMEMVKKRVDKLKKKELNVSDFEIKGAVEFLNYLRNKGIILYLASGTDNDDVIAEANAMGYAGLFNGGIYGAIGDNKKYTKKMVMQRIISDNNLSGNELVTFGDGPVEMRECRKVGGIAVGIASDEIRRHGLCIEKRTRLIKAGANFIIPDYSQRHILQEILFD
ncbi:MAG: PfkB family carbohydrate kinase [Bacteroidota bacterium]|nr:PfkB family carbohydrate kinase [Bacteroidota bacterium]